jgi:hypothetical protein
MNEFASYKKRGKAETIVFSSEFKRRVKEVRLKLGIPPEGFPRIKLDSTKKIAELFAGEDVKQSANGKRKAPPKIVVSVGLQKEPTEAHQWYAEHIQRATGKRPEDLPFNLPHYYWYFPREIAELIEGFAYSSKPCRPGFHPEVPLDHCALELIQEFGLPEDFVNEVKRHILSEESGSFGVSPMLQPIIIPMEGQDGPYLCAVIAGIDGSTTKKEWLDVWQEIKKQMQWKGIKVVPTKRDEEKIEIRDLTWWKWSKDGLSPGDIADKWVTDRAGEIYGEDTVRVAIKRIDDKMNPIQ